MDIKADIFESVLQTEIFHPEQAAVIVHILRIEIILFYFSSRHIINKLVIIDIPGRIGNNMPAVSKYGKLIRNLKHLIQLVADEQDRDPLPCSCLMTLNSLSTSLRVRAEVGSSMMISLEL